MNNRIVAERFLDNKRLVVIANPESQIVFINFYKGDKLLTDDFEFTWSADTKLKFDQDLNDLYGLAITKNNVDKIVSYLMKYLKYIKDDFNNKLYYN